MTDSTKQKSELRFQRFLEDMPNVFAENRLIKLCLLVCALGTIVNSVSIQSARDSERTIIIPFGQSASINIVGNEVSEDYLRALALNVVNLTGTYSASTAEHGFEEVLKLVHPSSFDKMRQQFRAVTDELKRFPSVTMASYLRTEKDILILPDQISIPVRRVRFTGNTKRQFLIKLTVKYRIEEGRFWITDLLESDDENTSFERTDQD